MNNNCVIAYLIFSTFVFAIGIYTAYEDQKLAAYWKERYKEKNIDFIYLGDEFGPGEVIGILLVSFIPGMNLLFFGTTLLYRKGLL